MMEFDAGICNLDAPVVFFPVRHHSPACARLVQQLIREIQPAAILIEGPSDFGDRLPELTLPHHLPIAIYSYIRLPDGKRRGAFYPFCIYSPEWQAIQMGHQFNIPTQFIDLPWADVVTEALPSHRYADAELQQSRYVATLCQKLGVETFDTLWDTLFEIDPHLTLNQYLDRCHPFCFHIRTTEPHSSDTDLRREAFMAEAIRHAMEQYSGQVLVITGGFHSYALYRQVLGERQEERQRAEGRGQKEGGRQGADFGVSAQSNEGRGQKEEEEGRQGADFGVSAQSNEGRGQKEEDISTPHTPHPTPHTPPIHPSTPHPTPYTPHPTPPEHGLALTPYSYDRLDSLTGYESGMPNPGFYHEVWQHRLRGKSGVWRSLLAQVARDLRRREQVVSTADLIAVETMAQGLATLRGHAEVWRQDLIDGIIGALVKEELDYRMVHPFLQAVYAAFRGQERGRLAEGTPLPPLVQDIQQQLHDYDLQPTLKERVVEVNLTEAVEQGSGEAVPQGLQKSRFLHRLRILEMSGFQLTDGSDLLSRDNLVQVWEQWTIRWTPDFDARCIEAAIYGATLADAAIARLMEQANTLERDAEQAAILLLDACLMGLDSVQAKLYQQLTERVRQDGSFFTTTKALGHVLYLYRYDAVLGTVGRSPIGALLLEIFQRSLWLLEGLGQVQAQEKDLLRGLRTLLETFENCASSLNLNREEFVQVLHRVSRDRHQTPLMQGATTGALWTLGEAPTQQIMMDLSYAADPDRLGDFLTGLFCLARETAQRHPELVQKIDELLMGYSPEDFLEALPALRLAFSYFTPREKHYLIRTLLQAKGIQEGENDVPLIGLEVSVEMAAQALAFETRLFQAVRRYGLRGGTP